MKKTCMSAWLLLGVMALTACGGASESLVESSASQPPARYVPEEPAQSFTAPADVSEPDSSAQEGQPDASQPEPDASQSPAASTAPESKPDPPAESRPETQAKPKPKPEAPTGAETKPETPEGQETQTPAEPEPPVEAETPAEPEPPVEAETPAEPEPKAAPTKADAQAYIGKSVSSLIAALGSPKGSDYAPSCLGDGEDGELYYDGFTVYTYRANGTETVQDVV